MPGLNFNPQKDIPDLSGKVIIVTGGTYVNATWVYIYGPIQVRADNSTGTAGIGKETVIALAAHTPSHVYFTGRSVSRANGVIESIHAKIPDAKISFLECDLASLASVASAVKTFLS